MCAATNTVPSISSTPKQESSQNLKTKPEPKWMRMKKLNKSSADKTVKPIAVKSSASAQQKPNEGTRNEKRARWAKKAVPKQKVVAPRKGPKFEYLSVCCSLPATKPVAGQKVATKDPDSGKTKDIAKGLGKWKCSGCKKTAKVTRKASMLEAVRAVERASVIAVDQTLPGLPPGALTMPPAPDCVVVTGGPVA